MIPNWIFKVADEVKESLFPEKEYKELLSKYGKGELKAVEADAVEEIAYLVGIVSSAISKLVSPIETVAEAQPEVSQAPAPTKLPERKVLPSKMPEPSTTKWKEIRFNKKDSKWQIISNVRIVRNFNSEAEALDSAKNI